MVDADLAFAGREHGTLLLGGRGVCRIDSVGPQPSIARCRALAEVFNLLPRDADQFEIPVLVGCRDGIAALLQPARERGRVDCPDHLLLHVQLVIGERSPFAIGALGRVHDQGVGMRIGVEISARVVSKEGGYYIAGRLDQRLAIDRFAGLRHIRLDVLERLLDGFLVGETDLAIFENFGSDTDAFRCRKRQIDAGPMHDLGLAILVQDDATELLIADLPRQQFEKHVPIDLPVQTEGGRPLAEPGGMFESLIGGVVVVFRKIVERLAGAADIVHAHHGVSPQQVTEAGAAGGPFAGAWLAGSRRIVNLAGVTVDDFAGRQRDHVGRLYYGTRSVRRGGTDSRAGRSGVGRRILGGRGRCAGRIG